MCVVCVRDGELREMKVWWRRNECLRRPELNALLLLTILSIAGKVHRVHFTFNRQKSTGKSLQDKNITQETLHGIKNSKNFQEISKKNFSNSSLFEKDLQIFLHSNLILLHQNTIFLNMDLSLVRKKILRYTSLIINHVC